MLEVHLDLVNQHLKFQKVSLVEPSESYYLHIAAEIDHPIFPFFLTVSSKKRMLIGRAKEWCRQLERKDNFINATVFTASLIPPGRGKFIEERKDKVHIARFDFVILIEAKTKDEIISLQDNLGYKEIESAVKAVSVFTHIVIASNVKRINPVNHNKQGVFLFNYFFADGLEQNLGAWEYTAGWFQQETGLDNSTVLLPIDQKQSKYTIINHCRWDKMKDILPSLIFKKSFHTYVLDNFYSNKVAAMPVLYKIA